ncbi:MAG: hypothetical protein ABSD71_02275 [Bacteroidales bacterium]|jgi:hypothetical protein
MSINPADNALIEKFLLGQLSDPEIDDFNCRLNCDREFARKFRLIKTFPEMMSEAGKIEMDRKLNEAVERVLAEKASHSQKKKRLLWIGGGVAVLGVILIILLLVYRQSKQPVEPEQTNMTAPPEKVVTQAVPAIKKDTATPISKPVNTEEKIVKVLPAEISTPKITAAISPSGGTTYSRKGTIVFKWTQKCDTFTRLCIYSETNGKLMLWRGVTPGLQEYKIPGSYLLPGKFFWYVRSKEDKHSFTVVE